MLMTMWSRTTKLVQMFLVSEVLVGRERELQDEMCCRFMVDNSLVNNDIDSEFITKQMKLNKNMEL